MHLYNIIHQLVSYSDDDKNPDVTPDEFENMHEICLHALKHATADTDTVEIVKNLSAPMLNTCRDSTYQISTDYYYYTE